MSKVGLVTTFRFVPTAVLDEEGQATLERCWSALSSFLLFHLAKGVEHVFLYADADDGSNQVYIGQSRFGGEACGASYVGALPACCAFMLPCHNISFVFMIYLRKVEVILLEPHPRL